MIQRYGAMCLDQSTVGDYRGVSSCWISQGPLELGKELLGGEIATARSPMDYEKCIAFWLDNWVGDMPLIISAVHPVEEESVQKRVHEYWIWGEVGDGIFSPIYYLRLHL